MKSLKSLTSVQLWCIALAGFVAMFVLGMGVGQATAPPPPARVTLREGGYHYIDPVLLCNVDPTQTSSEDTALSLRIKSYIAKSPATDASVYLLRIGQGKWAGVNINQTYSPASMLKVPTMTAILKYAESHEGFLSKEIYYDGSFDDNQAEFFKPKESIQPHRSYTVDQLLTYMIEYSDNNAAKLLSDNIDPNSFMEIYIDLGIRLPADMKNVIDFMSVKTYSLFLRLLYNSTYLTRELSEKTLKLMAASNFAEGLRKGVPSDIEVSEKFGEREVYNPDGTVNQRELHDCGIVYTPGNPYILCVMTRGKDFNELTSVIEGVSKLVYDQISTEKGK